LLSQPESAHGLPYFNRQPRLDLEFFGIGQAQVGEDVTRAELNLDAFNDSFLHVVAPVPMPRLLSADEANPNIVTFPLSPRAHLPSLFANISYDY
jgi:hypothetical protein